MARYYRSACGPCRSNAILNERPRYNVTRPGPGVRIREIV